MNRKEELIIVIRINEYAYKRRQIKDRLADCASGLLEHLIKLYLYPNHESTNHWKNEVYSYINRVGKFKSNKLPSAKFIYNSTWEVWGDTIEYMIPVIIKDYGHSPFSSGSIIIEQYCEEYFRWLSDSLSIAGLISRKECYNKIDELLNKWR